NRVPDVIGKPRGEAESLIEAAGFRVTSTTEEESADADPGTVIRQSPGPEEVSRLGSAVALVFAIPPAEPTPSETPTPTDTAVPTITPGG
ncbi:MAG: eukaryotic-like serine/threonine-protein kinase, partial [Actinomycetota bacterium]|nr:eukaryotic-like serine/threonine-protein kinase [Actinomycetota bacterium]